MAPEPETSGAVKKEHDVFMRIMDLKKERHTDQTGQFPYLSSHGNCYIMVVIHLDANYIFQVAIKTWMEAQIVQAYQTIMKIIRASGLSVEKYILDNKASNAFKEAMKEEGIKHELMPLGNHRRNMVKGAIQTFKAHFIAILYGVDDAFPMHYWDRLLKHTELTLNMLCQSNIAPKVLVYAHVHGPHKFMRWPLTPLGCKLQVYKHPGERATWGPHMVDA